MSSLLEKAAHFLFELFYFKEQTRNAYDHFLFFFIVWQYSAPLFMPACEKPVLSFSLGV